MRLAPEFVEKLRTVAATAKIGDPMLATTNIGPVTTLPQYNKVLDYIAIAKAEGARCVLGGKPATGEGKCGPRIPGDEGDLDLGGECGASESVHHALVVLNGTRR